MSQVNTGTINVTSTTYADSTSQTSGSISGLITGSPSNGDSVQYNGSAWVQVIEPVGTGQAQALGTGDTVIHANLSAITGTVQGVGQGNSPIFAGATISDGSNDFNIASHDGTNGLKLGGVLVTASAAELNLLDGETDLCTQAEIDARVTAPTGSPQGLGQGNSPTFAGASFTGNVSLADGTTTLNINSHDGSTGGLKLENVLVTSTATELNLLDGCTASTTELNLLDNCTASTTELNLMDGCTASTAELNTMDGITATTAELNIMDGVTANTTQINILDGLTSTQAELNLLDGVTSTTTELNKLDGYSGTTADLNKLDGYTGTTADLNKLDGMNCTTAELNILDGVTASNTELNTMDGITATTAELNLMDGVTATTAELNILDGVTSTATELNKLDGFTGTTANLNLLSGQTQLGTSVPVGGIVALASNITGSHSVPNSGSVDGAGWMICDGATIPANQTLSGNVPQLTDGRFLQGNTAANAGGTGDNNTITLAEANLPAHSHTVTTTAQSSSTTGNASSANTGNFSSNHTHDSGSNTGNHSHNTHRNTYSVNDFYAWTNNVTRTGNASTSNTGAHHHGNTGNTSANHTHGMDHTHSYSHTHTMSCANTGSGTAFSIVPTYLRVVYLIRVI